MLFFLLFNNLIYEIIYTQIDLSAFKAFFLLDEQVIDLNLLKVFPMSSSLRSSMHLRK